MTLGMRWEELPGMTLGLRWEELAGKRCANLIVPRMSVFSCGARCTNLLVPGVPRFSLGDRCTVLLVMGAPMVMLRVARFLGFVTPIVVYAGSSPPSFGVLAIFLTLALDVVRDCNSLFCRLSGLDLGLDILAEGPF